MKDPSFHLRKRIYSTHVKKTKEEQQKELSGIPNNIGPYELIEKLKDGGYSKIYKAKSNYTGEFVAIKAIEKMTFQESVEDVLLMVRQSEVLKILKHRNILNLYEIYESQKFFYLVMEYISNGDLIEHIIKKKRFQENEALVIFSQLVDALYYMHKNEICHRDIRTEKILFDNKNKPKLVGFSYSTFYNKDKKIRDSYGSLSYACPEIIQNDYYNPELADVWSLGVVLYVMVCGYLPFSEDDDEENKFLIINGKIDYPREISNKVKDLLKHMLEIDPNKRYNFQKIIKHPWFKPFDEENLTGGCNPYKMIYPVDERILKIIVIYGFNKKEVDKDLKQNIINNRTGLYKQLTHMLENKGFTSLSDLCSSDFMEFSRDKENIISDGDKKYKKYISKILEKINKVERYVNDYKKKEDKIIKDLEKLYNEVIEEEDKKNKKNKNQINKNYNKLKSSIHQNKNIKANIQTQNKRRKTYKSFATVKEQKRGVKYTYDKNENNNDNEIDNGEFDALRAFHEKNNHNNNNDVDIINNKIFNKNCNLNILYFEEIDDLNNSKKKRSKSNPDIAQFVEKLIEKDDRERDLYELDNDLYEENLNNFRYSRRRRQYSMMIRHKKRNYLNTGNENDYFLKRPKDSEERKKKIENNYRSSIKNVIIEENINEEKDEQNNGEYNELKTNDGNKVYTDINIQSNDTNNNINRNNEIKEDNNTENKRKKSLRFSLSFGDDSSEEEEENSNEKDNSFSLIDKVGSKKASMYDIDEEIKELKEIKNKMKSPLKGPYLKRNTNDNNLVNFNMDNNTSIFGEHLDENNISRKNSFLETVNEKYDLLTELKKLSENTNKKKKKEENNKNNEKNEISGFNNDSFGYKNDSENEINIKENKDNDHQIVFDDNLKISFNEEKNEKKSGYKIFIKDNKYINKINIFDKLDDMLLSISNINIKKEKQYDYKFINDINVVKKIKITNDNINIGDILPKIKKLKKFSIGPNTSKNKEIKIYNKIKKDFNNNKIKSKSTKNSNATPNKVNKIKIEKNIKINQFINKKNNNINFNNPNKNSNHKKYIFEKNVKSSKSNQNEGKINKITNINNKIIINSNSQIIKNISINNNNNFIFNEKQNIIKEKNYNKYITKNKKKEKIVNSKEKTSNKNKNNIRLQYASFIKTDKSIQKNKCNNSNKYSNETSFSKTLNCSKEKNSSLLKKNPLLNFKNIRITRKNKGYNGHFSLEKVFHSSLMSDNDEISKENLISKIKKRQKLNKIIKKEKDNMNKTIDYYNKFLNTNRMKNYRNSNNSNYSELYLKGLNSRDNSIKKNLNNEGFTYRDNINNKINYEYLNNKSINTSLINKFSRNLKATKTKTKYNSVTNNTNKKNSIENINSTIKTNK